MIDSGGYSSPFWFSWRQEPCWEGLARYSGWSASVFPGPRGAAKGMWELILNGTLLKHSVASLFRVTVGFYLAVMVGIPLGIILGWWKTGQVLFNSMIQFLRPISPLAWIPLAMLWFGIGDKPAIFLIFLSSFFPLLVSTITAVNRINSLYFQSRGELQFYEARNGDKTYLSRDPSRYPASASHKPGHCLARRGGRGDDRSEIGFGLFDSRFAQCSSHGLCYGRHDRYRCDRHLSG